MRTKALLCAAVVAAGLASSMAQSNVYSLNVVGYYNMPVGANQLVLIANQLNTTNNSIGSLIPTGPPDAVLYKFAGGYTGYQFDDVDLVWYPNALATMNPGEAVFYKSPVATTLTFVGEVLQGSLVNPLPTSTLVLRSSIVPQQGLITTDLGVPAEPDDVMYTFAGGYTGYQFDDVDLVWYPTQPTISVGQGFFYKKAGSASTSWVRNFTVQ
jgi:hypothetical protein